MNICVSVCVMVVSVCSFQNKVQSSADDRTEFETFSLLFSSIEKRITEGVWS